MSEDSYSKYPWRVCGLGFAIGEALRYSYGRGVTTACSTMACTYILCHALRRGINSEGRFMPEAADSLVFDAFASALIPSFITYHVCRLVYMAVYDAQTVPGNATTWAPTIVGLCFLCLTVDKVDKFVNEVMDKTIRQSSN